MIVAVCVSPPPVTVIVPVRGAEEVLAVKVAVKDPLFDPLAGDKAIQEALSVALQLTLDEMVNVVVPAPEDTFWFDGEIVKVFVGSVVNATPLVQSPDWPLEQFALTRHWPEAPGE